MIHQNISDIKKELGSITLVVVTKRRSIEELQEVYQTGHRIFGENRVQELRDKYEEMPKDVEWHMIGHLQKNKVKYIAPYITMIHAVDSLSLLKEIDKQAKKHNRVIPVLLQIHIAKEESKFGLDKLSVLDLLDNENLPLFQNISVQGLMGMATFTEDAEQIKEEFAGLKSLFEELKSKNLPSNVSFEQLSMGMSGDYLIAKNCGSTLVRVGSKVFA
jgi:PLP dependent protein